MVERLADTSLDREGAKRLEELIGRMTGVISAKVITDGIGRPLEIHVLTNMDRSAKQVARDVQSCAVSTLGIQVDHRIISIAQVNDDSLGKASLRLKIKGFEVKVDENSVTVTVSLSHKGNVYEGTATGMSKAQGRHATAALACVNCLHKFLGTEFAFSVVDVQKAKMAGLDAFTVVLSHIYDGRQTMLTGACIVQDDDYMAVIKATLQCVNRVLDKAWRDAGQAS